MAEKSQRSGVAGKTSVGRKGLVRRKVGLSPGALVSLGDGGVSADIALTAYDERELTETSVTREGLTAALAGGVGVKWLDVAGIHDVELIREIGDTLSIHPLVLEDIASAHQRPKVEFHDGYVFVVMRMACGDGVCREGGERELEQVSFLLGRGWLLSFRETGGPAFMPVRERLRAGKGRLRRSGADYLLYALLDLLVDQYFVAAEELSEEGEKLEAALLSKSDKNSLIKIHELRARTATLKRAAWPLRDLANALARDDSGLLGDWLDPYWRDLSDHIVQVVEIVEVQREALASYMDLYMSITGNRMNSVMSFLTVIATIFIPLTFLVGVWGMNFKYMPELEWQYGYLFAWGVMVATGGGMWLWFRRNRWL